MQKQKVQKSKHPKTTKKNILGKVDKIVVAKPWEKINKHKDNPVSHTGQQYLKFLNTSYFSKVSRYYLRHGTYTHAPEGTSEQSS